MTFFNNMKRSNGEKELESIRFLSPLYIDTSIYTSSSSQPSTRIDDKKNMTTGADEDEEEDTWWSKSSSFASRVLARIAQKSFVSCRKIQFSKRVRAMHNGAFARRLKILPHEDEETEEARRLVVIVVLGRRLREENKVVERIDEFFFASYVVDFPPVESKKMFLLSNTTSGGNHHHYHQHRQYSMTTKTIDFVADKMGGYTTDCGWGCTLRSAQMLFAEAMMRRERDGDEARRKAIVDMFSDDGDEEEKEIGTKNTFGLRRVYEGGEEENTLHPGQWIAPSEICKRYGKMVNTESESIGIRCLVSGDRGGGVPEFYPERVREEMNAHRNKDILVLVPLRCGAGDAINPRYVKSLQKFLSMRECVGIVGGKKSASYYIVGFTSNGSSSNFSGGGGSTSSSSNRSREGEEEEEEEEETTKAIYLDPHVAKAYEPPRARRRNVSTELAYYQSFFGSATEHGILYTPFRALDPSLVVGFLVRNRNDQKSSLETFEDALTKIERESGSTPLITVVDAVSKKSTPSCSGRTKRSGEKTGDDDDWEIVDGHVEDVY
tara:strand:+ start:594 stop:2243 length:1650 start_codon:yes stop_codon:yes gene_type:complete